MSGSYDADTTIDQAKKSLLDLYGLIVPKDNMLRRINDLIDFTFVYEELKDKYCFDNGRNAIDPIRMFK